MAVVQGKQWLLLKENNGCCLRKTRLLFNENIVLVVSKKLDCHRTPTEVRMYSDRGTHVSRPRYTCIPTETRRLSKIFDIMHIP